MSNKTIADLNAKNPANTDLIPVADPVTGEAGKSTVTQVMDSGIGNEYPTNASVTFTPTLTETRVDSPFLDVVMAKGGRSSRYTSGTGDSTGFGSNSGGSLLSINPGLVSSGGAELVTQITYTGKKLAVFKEPWNSLNWSGVYQSGNPTLDIKNFPSLTTLNFPNLQEASIDVNCANLSSISLPEFTYGGITLSNLAGGQNISFPKLKKAININIGWNNSATFNGTYTLDAPELEDARIILVNYTQTASTYNYNFPKLKYLGMLYVNIVWNDSLGNGRAISLPELVLSESFVYTDASSQLNQIGSISAPKLKVITQGPALHGSNIAYTKLTSVSLPALKYCSQIAASGFALLTTLDFPELVTACWMNGYPTPSGTTIQITSAGAPAPNLTTINLPKLKNFNTINITQAANLTTFNLNSTPSRCASNFTITNAKLNQASVDGILVALAYMDGNNGTLAYSSRTVNLSGGTSATPSATGLAAKATLVARGCTVTHN